LRQSWSKRVSAGDYAAVLAEAQAGGLDSTLAQRPLADLTAVSDAARYLGRSDVARQTLLAERERFAGSPDAKGAAFLLGRISQDGGDAKGAIAWFTVYLGEAPEGSFAAEALGRKLVAVRKVHGIEQAKPLAREYLDRFPNGAHAAIAREVARAR
jgi:TolA-binding protein